MIQIQIILFSRKKFTELFATDAYVLAMIVFINTLFANGASAPANTVPFIKQTCFLHELPIFELECRSLY